MMIEVVNNVQVCFGIMYRRENQRQYELRADTVSECKAWIDAIKMARSGQSYHYHYVRVSSKWQGRGTSYIIIVIVKGWRWIGVKEIEMFRAVDIDVH